MKANLPLLRQVKRVARPELKPRHPRPAQGSGEVNRFGMTMNNAASAALFVFWWLILWRLLPLAMKMHGQPEGALGGMFHGVRCARGQEQVVTGFEGNGFAGDL